MRTHVLSKWKISQHWKEEHISLAATQAIDTVCTLSIPLLSLQFSRDDQIIIIYIVDTWMICTKWVSWLPLSASLNYLMYLGFLLFVTLLLLYFRLSSSPILFILIFILLLFASLLFFSSITLPAIAEAIGLGAACDYLTSIGMRKIYEHEVLMHLLW